MKRGLFFLVGVSVILMGCNKQQPKPETAQAVTIVSNVTPEVDRSAPTDRADQRTADKEMTDLILTLKRVHFGFDTARLTPSARAALVDAAEKLNAHPEISLYVDGHTDPRGTTEYNMSLGERRAIAVVDYLTDLGIERSRLRRVSFGEEKPLSGETAPVAFARDRRVSFRVMEGNVELVLKQGTLLNDQGIPISTSG